MTRLLLRDELLLIAFVISEVDYISAVCTVVSAGGKLTTSVKLKYVFLVLMLGKFTKLPHSVKSIESVEKIVPLILILP